MYSFSLPHTLCLTQHLLRPFWGLMNESDRPWHYDAVVYLCCELPLHTRQRYRSLKPSTMQLLLSRRAQAEKGVAECLAGLDREIGNINRWQFQVGGQQWRPVLESQADTGA